jgi:hypothetical protein
MPDESPPQAPSTVKPAGALTKVGIAAGIVAVSVGAVLGLRPSIGPVVPPTLDGGPSAAADAPPPPMIVGLAECRKQRASGASSTPAKQCRDGGDATAIHAGSASCATAYYKDNIAAGPHGLGVFPAETKATSTLNDLLDFLGNSLRVSDLENTTSTALTAQGAGTILAVSIFAPKITNVSSGPATKYGWRKLVRILPAPASRATAAGIERAFVLLNYFQSDLKKSPFVGGSINTQVILVSTAASVQQGRDMAYWLDYGQTSGGAVLSSSLPATFDGRFPTTDDPTRPYFIPDGCISCHGESVPSPLLNYFDTDHIEDRLEAGNDFGAVTLAGEHMFADEGPGGCTHEQCFDVVRRLNTEMANENRIAQPCSSELQAASNWLNVHKTSSSHLAPTQRALSVTVRAQEGFPSPSPRVWSDSDDDKELLVLLNRYCFRCHGSIRFNVFDKEAVWERADVILLKTGPTAKGREAMPTDRTLPATDLQRLTALMNKLGGN